MVRSLPKKDLVRTVGLVDLYEYTERAIKVHEEFILDRQYVVRPGDEGHDEIVIVDEFTGRLAEGRKWQDGIHQAIEAKENLEISVPTGQAARITIQDLFLRYPFIAGMTGTAATSARELKKPRKTWSRRQLADALTHLCSAGAALLLARHHLRCLHRARLGDARYRDGGLFGRELTCPATLQSSA